MISLPELLVLKFPNINFDYEVTLADYQDGKGPVINQWNMVGVPRPDKATLAQWKSEVQEQWKQNKLNELNAAKHKQLSDIDMKSIRALREGSTAKLNELEAQAQAVRNSLLKDVP